MLAFMNSRLGLDKLAITLLEKGHTETENDSMHSVIELTARTKEIYTPERWYSAVRGARKSKTPYTVQEISVFIDFKEMVKIVKNMSVDVD